MHADPEHVQESLSTCEFARRVALIENVAKWNETTDPAIIIKRLKEEIQLLKAEISLLKGGEKSRDHLFPEEVAACNEAVETFIKSQDPSSTLIMNDWLKLNQCF